MTARNNFAIIRETAGRLGASSSETEYLIAIAQRESSGRADAANPNSSARGLFQFISSTAARYGLGPHNIYDPEAQTRAALALTRDNANALRGVLNGQEPTAGDLYLAHFMGAGGARSAIAAASANPDTPVGAVLSPGAIRANASIRFRGKQFSQFSVQDLRDWASSVSDGNFYVDARERGDLDRGREYARRLLRNNGVAEDQIERMLELERQNPFFGAIFQLVMRIIEQITPNGPLEVAPGDRLPVQHVQEPSAPAPTPRQPAAAMTRQA